MKATLKAEWTTAKDFDRSGTYKEELGTTQKTAQKTAQKTTQKMKWGDGRFI